MASSYALTNDPDKDPLYLFRTSIQTSRMPTLSTASDAQHPPPPIESARYAIFTHPSKIAVPLDAPTRWIARKDSTPFDLRSIIFAYERRDLTIPDYVSACQSLGDGKRVKNLGFLERTDLITWLTGAQKESDFLRPIDHEAGGGIGGIGGGSGGGGGGGIGAGTAGGVGTGSNAVAPAQQKQDANGRGAAGAVTATGGGGGGGAQSHGRPRPELNPELVAVYLREREIGNRNTVLRGIKPTDFSHVRKIGEAIVKRLRADQKPGASQSASSSNDARAKAAAAAAGLPSVPRPITSSSSNRPSGPMVSSSGGKPRLSQPIILLSPSTSALLRMSNIKDFLENGLYSAASTSSAAGPNIMDISRSLPNINPNAAMTFKVYDSTEGFKPDYWGRVVGVFTTGQLWQFKSYKWSTPQELFSNVKGFYVGWVEEGVPENILQWGNVQIVGVEKNRRFRDREVMEGFWDGVERWMTVKGWGVNRRQY